MKRKNIEWEFYLVIMEIEWNEEMYLFSFEEKRSILLFSFNCYLNVFRFLILSVDGEDDDEEEKKYIDYGF